MSTENDKPKSKSPSSRGDLLIIGLMALAALVAFTWHAASINGYRFWSRETLIEVLPWLALVVLILAAMYLTDLVRPRQRNRDQTGPD